MLAPAAWNMASAQTAITYAFAGSSAAGGLTGTGTLNPYGPTTIFVATGGSGSQFTVTFANGSTMTATSLTNASGTTITGTANITGGTGTFTGVTGSFNFLLNLTGSSSTGVTFTVSGSGTLNGAPPPSSTSYYFSHLAFGGGFQATLTYVNYTPTPVTCTTKFYSNSGIPLQIPFAQGNITTRIDSMPQGGSIHDQTTADLAANLSQGWATASCTGPVQASLLYRYFQSGAAVGEASVSAEVVPVFKFVTFAQAAAQGSTGVAYANPAGNQSATFTFTAFDATGAQLGTATRTLGPSTHSSDTVSTLLGLSNFTGSLVITSTIPAISLSLNAEAFPVFSSLPPGDLSPIALTGTQTYYLSHLAFAGGFQTTLTYINYGTQAVTCTTKFYADSGLPLNIPFAQGTISTRTDALAPGASIHDQTTADLGAPGAQGWAIATCTGPVQASLLYRLYQSNSGAPTAVGEASVNAETAPTTKFATFAQTATGVAYANPSTTQSASVTLKVFSAGGVQMGSKVVTLGPLGHSAANLGDLLGVASFSGFVAVSSDIPIVSLSLNAEAFPVFSSLPPGDLPNAATIVSP